MKPYKSILVIIGIIQNSRGEILLSQRLDPAFAGAHEKWDFPGGKNEVNETPRDTVKREILEETGLTVQVHELLPDAYQQTWEHEEYFQHTVILVYRCTFTSGTLQLTDSKIRELRWVKPEDVQNYDVLPGVLFSLRLLYPEKMSIARAAAS